ncbi:MAG: archaeosortase/exosortase family protein, partial [Verrucomicrobiota bacterium]|nr:archaeosortase/exosortase family protein [Verrucomicrobiota bacterium]
MVRPAGINSLPALKVGSLAQPVLGFGNFKMIGKKWLLWLALLAGFWFVLLKHLAVHWSINPQYSFGWLVPFLTAYALLRRWIARPAPTPAASAFAGRLMIFAALLFLPTWLLEQPNPDWRLISWTFAAEVVAISLGFVYFAGGKSWTLHFAFPLCLILTAIPWPTFFENAVIQNLMVGVAAISVESLNIFGVPAVQHGNVIEISAGLLGIDEACSGVRSLQATFMASLFLGELYKFSIPRRVTLVVAGLVLAVICNTGRAFLLAWNAAQHGMEAVGKLHDPAGFTILTICFILLWLLALLISPRGRREDAAAAQALPPNTVPLRLFAIVAACLAISLLGTEIWYRVHERDDAAKWAFEWPAGEARFKEIEIAEAAAQSLQYDEGRGGAWTEPDGTYWQVYFFQWKAGPARSRILARTHRPEICLPASGITLQSEDRPVEISAGNISIPFRAYTFQEANGQPMHVFFCLWQDRREANVRVDWGRMDGLQMVLDGERNVGQQVLEVAISGYATMAEAEAALRRRL